MPNFTEDLMLCTAARIAHNVNRAYCEVVGPPALAWEVTPESHKTSLIAGVRAIYENPNTTPEQGHKNWLRIKAAEGWTYGEVKNPELKTHPCFLPYEELPPAQRYKDTLFHTTVRGVLAKLEEDRSEQT